MVGSLSQLIRTLSLQAVLLEFTRAVLALDGNGLAAAAHQAGPTVARGGSKVDIEEHQLDLLLYIYYTLSYMI